MYKLRPYQQEAVDRTIEYFKKSNDPAIITLPTGAGKSIVIAKLAQVSIGRVLVMAHVKELVEQNHEKLISLDVDAGIYSASLNKKDASNKVIFGSIQSIANAHDNFFSDFSLVIIDEAHRVSLQKDSQYQKVLSKLAKENKKIKVLGLTATPYRLDLGWCYNYHYKGSIKTNEDRFFKHCIYELPLSYLIKNKYLTNPIIIDSPVACYDFSKLTRSKASGLYSPSEITDILKSQERITPSIVKNILDKSKDRNGVMVFTSTIEHAKEILSHFPNELSCLITGDTPIKERERIINDFKSKKLKYLINVSVLTTGFDAPHVDLIALLRPTESVSLYQQIIGRGLRLYEGKEDCLVLDYTGLGYNIYSPEIGNKRPAEGTMPVKVECPKCNEYNDFWGIMDENGYVIEHFGRKCTRGTIDERTIEFIPCGYLYRYKLCTSCSTPNDISARKCISCNEKLQDPDQKLKEAMSLKDAHVLRVDSIEYKKSLDKKKKERLEINYYDFDANKLTEYFYLDSDNDKKIFYHNFVVNHLKNAGSYYKIESIDKIIQGQKLFRIPSFVIARQVKKFWIVREKIFN
ncbi:MAG: DEAD/DEAH box helicase [Bacteriovoracaceae bacterium]|jgi:DNA repair protein RadD|nr:DEAD/DEAH box helicase [Bacteriovoracaceae bacterium]